MYEDFETYMTAQASFTAAELKLMRSLTTEKKLRRRQFLLQEGEVCRHKIFVTKGLLKAYLLKDDGMEYIMRFSPENTWAIDHESFNNQTPSKYYIEALEDTEVILLNYDNTRQLLETIPAFRMLNDKLKALSLDASQQRILSNISYTSEEKYQDFIASFPDVFRRVPLHMVASYLGVSRETLSRIRQAQVKQTKE